MTLLELRNAVVANTRRTDKAANGDIDGYINLALQELGQIEPFRNLRSEIDSTLLAGSNSIALPTGTVQVVQVRLLPTEAQLQADAAASADPTALAPANIGYLVYIMDQRTLQARFPNRQINTRGIPEFCFVTASTIEFIPPTSLDRTVRVLLDGYVPSLDEDTDESPLPQCDNAVISWATKRTFESLTLWEDAQYWAMEYKTALRFARMENQRTPGQIRQMRGAQHTRPRYIDPRQNNYTRQTYGDILE